MIARSSESGRMDNSGFLWFLLRWKKPLLIVAFLSAAAAYIFSLPFFIKPKYKSTVILYPASSSSLSGALMSEDQYGQRSLLEFGEEEDAEQMLQILESDDIRNFIVRKYNLMKHYEINPEGDLPNTRLQKMIESNIRFSRTEYMSVKIEVYDTDPETASLIANDIADYVDTVKTRMLQHRAKEALNVIEQEYLAKRAEVKEKEDSLEKLRSQGMFDYNAQAKILNEEYIKALSLAKNEKGRLAVLEKHYTEKDTALVNTKARIQGAEATLTELKARLENLASLGGSYVSLNELLWTDRGQLAFLKKKFEKARVDAQRVITHKFVVNRAVKPEQKAYPVRWIIMVVSVFSALFMCFIVLTFIDNISQAGRAGN